MYLSRLQNSQEKRLNSTIRKHDEDKASLKNHHSAIVRVCLYKARFTLSNFL